MNQNIEIIVIDDNLTNDDPLMIVLQEEFSEVRLFTKSRGAWQFCSEWSGSLALNLAHVAITTVCNNML